jgi:serine/threonine-protein kinase
MDQIGRYKIIGELGRGAMGVVYHATDPAIGRSVAIKTIRIRDISDERHRERLRERLFREARSAGVLSHPNIVTIYDMDESDGLAYIAMAYVNGPTLEHILSSDQALSGTKMLRILRQAAAALDYAHARGIVHRDVKPANIMTDEDGSVKITDFGIAKIAEGTHSTDTKSVAGTPNYMSPEQVQGLPVDGRSDQFSLAVIAYEILTGERPFVGEHLSTIVFKIIAEEPPPAFRVNTTLTQQIDDVLRKALSKKPEDRFPNCATFVGALEFACAESRGWQTLPSGAAAALPTMAVDEPTPPPAPAPVPAPASPPAPRYTLPEMPFREPKEPPRRSRILPVLFSLLIVSGVAAVFVYQAGLVGGPPVKPTTTAEDKPKPPVTAPVTAPVKQEPEKTEPLFPPPTNEPEPETPKPQDPAPEKPAPEKPSPSPAPPPIQHEKAPPAAVLPEKANPTPTPTPPASRLQDIWVTSNPPGTKAVLDGNLAQACNTPCMLRGLPGRHNIALSHAGYMNEYREVTVGNTAIDLPQVNLQQPLGTLFLTTTPAGAAIRVNGELNAATTPAALRLTPGTYTITVEKNGVSKTERIPISDSVVRLSFTLEQ